MARPLAYFLTWTTYGTRVHGDARGSVDRDHNWRGTPSLPADEERERSIRATMTSAPVVFDLGTRAIVEQAIRDHIAIRKWDLRAVNVRSNHVHVVTDCRIAESDLPSPERVMAEFKYWGTRRLRDAGMFTRQTVWTDHGSTRWINHTPGLAGAIEYVNDRQEDRDWRTTEEKLAAFFERLREMDEAWKAEGAAKRSQKNANQIDKPSADEPSARAEGQAEL